METETKEEIVKSILRQNPNLVYEAKMYPKFRSKYKQNYTYLLLVNLYPDTDGSTAYRYVWDKERLKTLEIVDLLELGKYIEEYKQYKHGNIL